MKKIILATGLVAGMLPGLASAAAITLFNTGVDANGVVLGNNAIDTHYTMSGAESAQAQIMTDSPVGGAWIGENTTSAWIMPEGPDDVGLVGEYTYTTTFDLTGLDAMTAEIAGVWSTDNQGTSIVLNGNVFAFTTPENGYNAFHDFALNSGFVDGVNTLQFIFVNNSDNSGKNAGFTGLRVEMAGTADVSAVPVPAAAWLFGSALMGLASIKRKKTV